MTGASRSVFVGACAVFLLGGCQPQAPTRPDVYGPLVRAERAIAASITVGVSRVRYNELVHQLATEILVAEAQGLDVGVVKAYRTCLAVHLDAQTIWDHKLESDKASWTQGAIYQTEPLIPLVERYKLATSARRTPGVGEWTAIEETAVQSLWSAAEKTCGEAEKARASADARERQRPL